MHIAYVRHMCYNKDMTKSATVNSRIEPGLKQEAESIFATLGLSTSDAITLFYKQVSLHNGLPFSVSIPSDKTQQAMDELAAGKGEAYDSFADIMRDIDA